MKKWIPMMAAAALGLFVLTGCGAKNEPAAEPAKTEAAAETTAAAKEETPAETTAEKAAETAAAESKEAEGGADAGDQTVVRVGGLKGPTTMGLVKLMDNAENKTAKNEYEFTMVTAADELTALVAQGKVDIALLPANVASVLYNKTGGKIQVVDINTLGVLYLVSADTSVESVSQLAGRTVYLPGKGTTPEYALRFLLSAEGLTDADVTLEFKSEASEVAAILAENPSAIGLLPQPFVTSAMAQNEKLSMILDLTEAWDAVQTDGSRLVTGVTIANTAFVNDHKELLDTFLEEHAASIRFADEDPDAAAELIAAAGIVPKAPIAKKALPFCSIRFLSGEEMKEALSGYLAALHSQNPQAVGGTLPDDGFYYIQ